MKSCYIHLAFVFLLGSMPATQAATVSTFFNNGSALDGTIDGTSEIFRTGVQSLGDADFRFTITVESDGGGVLIDQSGDLGHVGGTDNDIDATGENVTFTLALTDFSAGATGPQNVSDVDFTFSELAFQAAGSGSDSGTISSINGGSTSFTWTDINANDDFTGHDSASSNIDLFITNGNNNVTSFKHDYSGGAWRINVLRVEFNDVTAVPEPGSIAVLSFLIPICFLRKKRRIKKTH